MADINLIMLEFFSLLAIIILVFSFSAISAEPIIIVIAIIILSILVFPYLEVVNEIEEFMFDFGFENDILFNILYPYSLVVILFIGFFLFLELLYIFLFN